MQSCNYVLHDLIIEYCYGLPDCDDRRNCEGEKLHVVMVAVIDEFC